MRPVSAKGLICKLSSHNSSHASSVSQGLTPWELWADICGSSHSWGAPLHGPCCIFGWLDSKRKNKKTRLTRVKVICRFKNHQSWLNQFVFPPPDAQVSFLRSPKALKAVPLTRAITIPLISNFKPLTTLSHSSLWYSSGALLRPFVKAQWDRPEAL